MRSAGLSRVVVGVTLAGAASMTSAQSVSWTNPTGGSWFDTANWSGGVLPLGGSTALFELGAPPYLIGVGNATALGALKVGFDRPRLVIDNAATLTLTSTPSVIVDGGQSPAMGILALDGGAVVCNRIDVGQLAGRQGTLELRGGTSVAVTGDAQLGFGGWGAIKILEGSTLNLSGTVKFPIGGSAYSLLEISGPGSAVTLGGGLQTYTTQPVVTVGNGGTLTIPGAVKLIHPTATVGFQVAGEGTRCTIGSTLELGYLFSGIGWYAGMVAADGGTIEVNGIVRVGGTGWTSVLTAADGGVITCATNLLIAPQGTGWSGSIDIKSDASLTVGGSIRCGVANTPSFSQISGPVTANGLFVRCDAGTGGSTIVEPRGTIGATSVTIGSASTLRCRGGIFACPVSAGGEIHARITDAGVDGVQVDGPFMIGPNAFTWLRFDANDAENLFGHPAILRASGTLIVDGTLDVDVNSVGPYLDQPRPPIALIEARTLVGDFDSIIISDGPGVAPIELKRTASALILQWSFASDGDDDGDVDAVDLARMLGDWGLASAYDADGDGSVDWDDALILIDEWTGSWGDANDTTPPTMDWVRERLRRLATRP